MIVPVIREASGAAPQFIHATAVVIGEAGIVIRGPSGSGKSSLALLLLAEAERGGRFARLVGDDRVSVTAANGVAVIRPHPILAGRIERPTQPIGRTAYANSCVARLMVELSPYEVALPRLPETDDPQADLTVGVSLPLLRLQAGQGILSCRFVFDRLKTL